MRTTTNVSTAQLSLFPKEESVKSTVNGNNTIAKFSTYIHSRDALWRMLACFPPQMPVVEAPQKARLSFTCGKEVAL